MYLKSAINLKNNNLTLIRFILAILVIYGHSFSLTRTNINSEVFIKYFHIDYSGSCAVALFFFTSGLLVSKSYIERNQPISFILARFFRIMPALFVSAIFLAFIAGPMLTTLPLPDYFNNKETYSFIYNNLLMHTQYSLPGVFEYLPYSKGINGSWWTIKYEVMCYSFLLFFGLINGFKNKYIATFVCLAIIILAVTDSTFIRDNFSNDQYVYYLPFYFCTGCLFYIWSDLIQINTRVLIGLIGITILCRNTSIYPILFFLCSSVFILILSIYEPFKKIKIKHDISYGIYIYGFFIQQLLIFLFPNMNNYWNTIFAILISMIFALISAKYIEEPAILLGKKMSKCFYNNKNHINLI
jgi:peptidoglycan/LPS O-acetylase OafA/YrhL